jgi:hypothetical protein
MVTGPIDLDWRLRAEGLDPGGWSNGPGDRYAAHRHAYDKVIVVAAGSITFGLPGSGLPGSGLPRSDAGLALSPGDRLELPAGTDHDAIVGVSGVSCLEAHLPAGSLRAARRLPAGAW